MTRARRSHGVTRRTFLKGTAALGGAVAVASLLPGCTNPASSGDGDRPVQAGEGDAVNVTESYEEADLPLAEQLSWSLPPGCVLHPGDSAWAAVTSPAASSGTMVAAQALSLLTGAVNDVLPGPVGEGANWTIYDVRCSDRVYAWVELDVLSRAWALYAQPFEGGSISGSPTELWEADAEYEPPQLCCTGGKVLWQVMPSLSGSRTAESSMCYLWECGADEARAVVESPGRFATPPTVSGDQVVLAPRVNADEGVYYGITAYSLDDDLETVVDRLTLPVGIAPFKATRIGEEFAFSIEANYQSGGLFANMGTYIGHGDGPFVWLSREPAADVAGSAKGLYVVKSTSSYFVIDTEAETYAILAASDNCVDYGEYPAVCGETSRFVTFATVKDEATGSPAEVRVRTFGM